MSNRTLPLMLGFVVVLMVALVAVLAIVLLGGNGDDDSVPANGGGGGGGGGESPTPATGGATPGGFCRDQFLVTFGSDPASVLDPIQARDTGTAEYVVEIFGGLVSLDLDLNVIPDLAEDWEISDDGLTYTFRLRNNALFHSQRRVTAEDVKFSIERAADPANASPTVLTYLDAVEGVRERFNNQADEVSGVQVVDEQTIQFRLIEPRDWFLEELTYPVAFVVDRNQIESNPRGWTREPNGTGPFRLLEFTPAERIILIANDNYHLGRPLLDRVIFELGGGSILTRYENNELHVGGVPPIELQAVQAGASPLSEDYKPQPQMSLFYFAFNTEVAPFDDINVRKALSLTIDKERINEVLLFGTQRVATGILPPEMPGFNESITSAGYDPDEARRLLEESSYAGNVPRIVLTFAGSAGGDPTVLQAIQAGWQEELGIEVEIQAIEYAAFLRELRRGTFQMYSAGWAADYPDPENFIDKLFAADSNQNEFGYANEEVQELIEAARAERDRSRRFDLLSQAEQAILDDAVVIPYFWPIDHYVVKSCVQNWPSVPMIVPKYRYIEIDPNAD